VRPGAKEQQSDVTSVMAILKDQVEEKQADFADKAEDALAALREKAEEARTLAVALGAVGVSGGHGQYAKEQRTRTAGKAEHGRSAPRDMEPAERRTPVSPLESTFACRCIVARFKTE
jgi:hypothetical protein